MVLRKITLNRSLTSRLRSSPVIQPPLISLSASKSNTASTDQKIKSAENGTNPFYVRPTFNSSPTNTNVSSIPTLLQPRVVIYDGVCHLCHRGVKWITKIDKYAKIKFCCLQSKAAEPYLRLCGVDREDVLRRFLFIEGPEAYYEGSTAALKVASYLPLPYSILSGFIIIPAPLRDALYDYVAKRRYDWFGKEDECIIKKQDQELLERFIDRDEMFDAPDNHFN